MKRILAFLWILAAGIPLWASAEPISFEQISNVTGSNGGFQVGAGYTYGEQHVPQGDLPTINRFYSEVPMFLRLGFPGFEVFAEAPYSSIASSVTEKSVQGVRNVDLGLKLNAMVLPVLVVGAGADVNLPTVSNNDLLYGEGQTVTPFAGFDVVTEKVLVHFMLGYTFAFAYDRQDPSGSGATVSFMPGDQWRYGLSAELNLVDPLWLVAEVSGSYYGRPKSAGDFLPGSFGNVLSFFPGLRFQWTPVKAKAGVEIPLQKPEDRPAFVPRYDWRLVGEVSLLVPFGSTSSHSEKGGY